MQLKKNKQRIQAFSIINFGLLFEVIDVPLVSSRSIFEEKKILKKTQKEKYKNYDQNILKL